MIIPAIIAENQCQLDNALLKILDEVPLIHLDIADNTFTKSKSLNFDFYLPNTTSSFEAHLMINDPITWMKSNWWKVDTIIVHIETCPDIQEVIDLLEYPNTKLGIAISPKTLEYNIPCIDSIDQLTILTVNPGFYGSEFVSYPILKIPEIKKLAPDIKIEVDGGINPSTIKYVHSNGADMLVSGSYVMNSKDPLQSIKTLEAMI